MEFIQFIISLLSTEDGLKLISLILGLLTGNPPATQDCPDDTPDQEIEEMFKEITEQKQNSPTSYVGESYALSPIASIAGKDVIYMLTRYFANVKP